MNWFIDQMETLYLPTLCQEEEGLALVVHFRHTKLAQHQITS